MSKRLEGRINDEEWLRQRYVDDDVGTDVIADEADCSVATVRRRIREFDIESDRRGPAGKDNAMYGRTGLDHPACTVELDVEPPIEPTYPE